MAVIGKIRKHSALLVIVVGVALAAFVLGDFFKPGNRRQVRNIAEVNGTEITGIEFNKKVEEAMEIRRQNMGNEAITPQEAFSIRQSVYQEMVSEIIYGEEFEKLGLTVTTEELDDQIRGNQPHEYIVQNFQNPETGEFNPQTVTQFLRNFNQMDAEMQQRYLLLEKMIKTDRERTKYNNLIAKAYYTPTLLAQIDYTNQNKKAVVSFVAPKYTSIPDSMAVPSDKDFEKYYSENREDFKQDPYVDIEYVVFDVLPSPDDRKNIAEEVDRIYQEFERTSNVENFVNAVSDERYDSSWFKEGTLPVRIDSIMFHSPPGTIYGPYIENEAYHIARLMDIQMRPDSMRASHILIGYSGARGGENINRTKQRAEELADSLYNVVSRNKNKFKDLAVEFSDDPSVERNEGDLDWFPDGMMVYPFNQAVLEGDVGDVVMAETLFGYHIIHITDKLRDEKKVRVAMIKRAIEPSSETFQEIYLEASDFATRNNTIEAFNKAVTDQGLNKRSAEKIGKMTSSIAGIEYPRQIIYWAFSDKTSVGDVSQVFDMGESYVVATLKNRVEGEYAPLEAVQDEIEPLVMREKKAEILIGQINEQLAKSSDLNALAKSFDMEVDTLTTLSFNLFNISGYGPEKEVIGAIFSMNEGDQIGPVKGNQGVFVLKLEEYIEPAGTDDFASQRDFKRRSFQSLVARRTYPALEEKSDIEDNRLLFY